MKVIFVTNILSNNNIVRARQIRRLLKPGDQYEVLFCARTESNRRWQLREKINFPHQILPGSCIRFRGQDLFTYFINPGIGPFVRRLRPDWIIVGGWDQFAYQYLIVWAKLHHRRLTLFSGSTGNESSWRRLLMAPLVRLLVRLSSDFFTYGTRSRDYLQALGAPANHIRIIKNDVNRNYFIREARKNRFHRQTFKRQFGLKSRFHFLYVGQLIDRKGLPDLLAAFSRFSPAHPRWGLVIVGYGQLENWLRSYLAAHPQLPITFVGHIDQYDLPPVYSACDCLVLPSHEEVWGLVVNEALYSGLKVIVSSACGYAPDLVKPKSNGLIFSAGDVPGLESALNRMSALIS